MTLFKTRIFAGTVLLFAATAFDLAAANATLTLIPPSGAIGGPPGSTVGWGFTITNSVNFIEVTGSNFCLGTSGATTPCVAPVTGTYNDFISSFNDIIVGPPPESPSVTQNFDNAAHTGVGSFQINAGATPGQSDVGQIIVFFNEFSRSPNDPMFDPGTDTVATDGFVTAPASVEVTSSPTINKVFGAPSIPLNGTTTLTFNIANPNALTTFTGVSFTDPLPVGLVVSTPNGLTVSPACVGGTTSAGAGGGNISLTNASIAPGATCTIKVNVTGTSPGTKNNTSSIVTSNQGSSAAGASASIAVVAPPSITKAFASPTVTQGVNTPLTFTITNPNGGTALTGVGFTDTLPAGLQVATPNNLNPPTGCNGTVPVAAGGTITLTGATIPAGGLCTFSVDVIGTTLGVKPNTTGNVTSANGGPGNTAAATVTVVSPPDAYKVGYASNLLAGDSYVNLTNTGVRNGFDPAGGICVNVYAFDPSEELVSCCACYVTPDGLRSLSVKQDLAANTLTPGVPGSLVIKLVATAPITGSTCNAATTAPALERGSAGWATSLHQNTATGTYQVTENVFQSSDLSDSELAKLTTYCGFIQGNGSGFGICKSCRIGGLGGAQQ